MASVQDAEEGRWPLCKMLSTGLTLENSLSGLSGKVISSIAATLTISL